MGRLSAGIAAGLAAICAGAQELETPLSGQEVFEAFCVICHGPRGQGSPLGASFLTPQSAARTDDELARTIREGRADKGMMPFATLRPEEISGVIAVIRDLQGKNAERQARVREQASQQAAQAEGERRRAGEALFMGKAGCIQCHSVFLAGGAVGPNLDGVAVRLTADQIREALEHPSRAIADGFAAKKATLPDGTQVHARFRNESVDTIQLLNSRGDLWTTYFKDRLQMLADSEESLMPAVFGTLTPDEQIALMTFLESLK